ncbi:hypothetical protein NVS55_08625 [Myxococcus stipitatus]|uniref:hypothetical protein n=1 Tax=Myxococcus stipitatus TaxID=83455 RepID=UPI003144D40F
MDSVAAAGWVNQSGEEKTLMAAHAFTTNAYRIGALVEGDTKHVMSVWLRESRASDREAPDSPLHRAVVQVCPGVKEGKPCRLKEHSFWSIECGGGWLFYSTKLNPDRKQLDKRCSSFGAILQ